MSRIRALGAALAVALLAGVLASAAPAARPGPTDHTLTTTHFVIHYDTAVGPTTDAPSADYASETDAGDIAAYAEQAYSLYTSWGLTPPVDDGDGHIDIYLQNLPTDLDYPSLEAYAAPDNIGPGPSSGAFVMATPLAMTADFIVKSGLTLAQEEQKTVANELFVLFEFAKWVPTSTGDMWLEDGAAQWAAFDAMGYPGSAALTGLASPDLSLDCRDDLSVGPPISLPFRMCSPDRYTELGYTRWAFFQLLANKYGPAFLSTALANGESGQSAVTALGNALAAKGSSLASVYNEYSADLMNANFGVVPLEGIRPTPYAGITTGTKAATLAPVKISVDHLAARYLTFQRGDGDGSHACYAAQLTINVAIPSGTSAQPYFLWDVSGSSPQPLSVNGSNASITVPWDTCDWGGTRGWLSLPNASTTVDAATFTVTSSLTVDTNTPANATSAPTQTPVWGTTVPVPTTDVAPSIDVFGPELLHVSSASPTIRLIVESNGPGTLNAALGTTVLGTGQLRAGNNDLRWTLPKGLLTSLRTSASATNLLTLTPLSPSGAASGSPVMLHVVVTAPAKAKKAAKPKPKKHPKK
jgi:hypothetical protein